MVFNVVMDMPIRRASFLLSRNRRLDGLRLQLAKVEATTRIKICVPVSSASDNNVKGHFRKVIEVAMCSKKSTESRYRTSRRQIPGQNEQSYISAKAQYSE